MRHSITIHSRWRFISQICGVAVCAVVFLSLISCGSGGSGSSGSPSTASTGSNVVTGTMPTTAVASREPAPDRRSFFAQLWNFLTTEPLAYALSKGSVQVVGTSIKALPVGGGRFELIGVPDGPVTIQFTTPDGVTGTLTLNVPQGGGALMDLGTVIVKHDGRVEFRPSSTNARFPNVVKARGKVSDLAAPVPASAVPTDGTCQTFVVAGLTFCFDQHTRFDPPLTVATPFVNSDTTNKLIVDVVGEPTGDSNVFHARRIQRNHGAPAAVNETIKVLAPITKVEEDAITLFGGTSDDPDAHAITFNTASAKFEPGALKQNVVKGLLVEVIAGPVSTDNGNQTSVASTVKLVRLNDKHCSKGELLDVEGTISSLIPESKTFGLNSDKLFVHVIDNLTRFDDPLTSFDSLKVDQLVEVTALPPQTTGGPLQAVEVEIKDALGTTPSEVRGTISSLNTTSTPMTFIVAGITFCYNCNGVTTQFEGLTAATLADGQFVEVHGTALSNGVSTALEVEREDDPRPSSCSDHEGRDDDREGNDSDHSAS